MIAGKQAHRRPTGDPYVMVTRISLKADTLAWQGSPLDFPQEILTSRMITYKYVLT